MAKYLLSVYSDESRPREPMTEEQQREGWAKIQPLEADLKASGSWVFSARLHCSDTATVVRTGEGDTMLTDGPFVESKEHIAGFYIIDAPDLDAALGWATRVSQAIGEPIEVWPFAATSAD